MPYSGPTNRNVQWKQSVSSRDRERYPEGFNLDPRGENHRILMDYLLSCLKESRETMHSRHGAWRELDRKLTGFIDLSTVKLDKSQSDAQIKADDPHKPVSLVLPQSYATREVALTFQAGVFLKDPIFRYESPDPADTISIALLEKFVQHQATKARMSLDLHSAWSDDFTYGFGAIHPRWTIKRGTKTRNGVADPVIKYAGNELVTMDPYNVYPDINRPIYQVDKMRYFGWAEKTDVLALKEVDREEEMFFNLGFLGDLQTGDSYFYVDNTATGRNDRTGLPNMDSGSVGSMKNSKLHVIWMYAKIIPEWFGLGGEFPTYWLFAIAADSIVIAAQPLLHDMNEIPVCVSSCKYDGHSVLTPSILEMDYPIQNAMDWLWNSHQANVRKVLNNMFVIDPALVNMWDFIESKAGLIARMRPDAWGKGGIDAAVKQLNVQDVTQNHIGDIGFLQGMSDKFSGMNAQVTGDMRSGYGSRISADESRATRMGSLSRREKDAMISGAQMHYKIAEWLASNTLQYAEGERLMKISGEFAQQIAAEYGKQAEIMQNPQTGEIYTRFDPKELDAHYEIVPNDGSLINGEFADVWERLMNNAASHQEVYQRVDFTRVWLHVARLLGAKNPHDFLKAPQVQTNVMPDAQVEQGIQSGNLAPVENFNAAG